jgi:hypothetical protein
MTGPQHYTEAEKLIVAANKRMDSGTFLQVPRIRTQLLAEAQVHATLALTAATVQPHLAAGDLAEHQDTAWRQAVVATQ